MVIVFIIVTGIHNIEIRQIFIVFILVEGALCDLSVIYKVRSGTRQPTVVLDSILPHIFGDDSSNLVTAWEDLDLLKVPHVFLLIIILV